MGLDPFTSTAIAEVAADKTNNDPTIPAAITAGGYGQAATSAYDGNTGQAAQQAAIASIPVVTGGLSGGGQQPIGQNADGSFIYPPAGGGGGGGVTPGGGGGGSIFSSPAAISALIGGGSDLLGIALQGSLKDKQPRPGPIIANPAYQDLMNRYLGIIDSYMQKHGIKPYVAPPTAPAAAPAGGPGTTAAASNATPALPPAPPAVPAVAAAPAVPAPPKVIAPAAAALDGQLQDAQLAASLGARRLGIKTDAPRLPTTRTTFEQTEAEKQKQLNDTYNYIYGQRALGV